MTTCKNPACRKHFEPRKNSPMRPNYCCAACYRATSRKKKPNTYGVRLPPFVYL